MSDQIPTILVVEDDKDLQFAFATILKTQGYRTVVANNGLDALNLIKNNPPDIVVLDYLMPIMDGKTFLQNYDATLYPETKILVASNVSDEYLIQELRDLGATETVLKADLSPMALISYIDTLLQPAR